MQFSERLLRRYRMGDMDGDSVQTLGDYGDFKNAYDAANGVGSFAAMLAGVPEPTGLALAALAAGESMNSIPETAVPLNAHSGCSVEAKYATRNLWTRFVTSQSHNAICGGRLAFG